MKQHQGDPLRVGESRQRCAYPFVALCVREASEHRVEGFNGPLDLTVRSVLLRATRGGSSRQQFGEEAPAAR